MQWAIPSARRSAGHGVHQYCWPGDARHAMTQRLTMYGWAKFGQGSEGAGGMLVADPNRPHPPPQEGHAACSGSQTPWKILRRGRGGGVGPMSSGHPLLRHCGRTTGFIGGICPHEPGRSMDRSLHVIDWSMRSGLPLETPRDSWVSGRIDKHVSTMNHRNRFGISKFWVS